MLKKARILIIEDDKYISNFIHVSLEKDDYEVITAESAVEGMFMFSSHHPDIVLLDLGLPDQDGLEVVREIRQTSSIPILVVSARGEEREKIEALDLGVNDYITKPFHMGELMARIRVAERSMTNNVIGQSDSVYTKDCLAVDFARRRVSLDSQEIHLTPIEYRLLLLLITHKGKVLTHNYIMRQIWGYESQDTKSVRVYMANLRRKIEKDTASPRFILTEVGVGYRFTDD
jgi:two-component system, OmpR family, KDP operon response regulator KdpE